MVSMYILNPPFLRQTPPRRTQFAVLLVLLCSALPLAASLPLVVMALFGGLWLLRRKRFEVPQKFGRLALWMLPTPFLANASGWIFTEMGRQPWVVVPNWANPEEADPFKISMLVQDGVSFNGSGLVWTSLIIFTLLYAALGVVWFLLERRYVREGPAAADDPDTQAPDESESDKLSFAY